MGVVLIILISVLEWNMSRENKKNIIDYTEQLIAVEKERLKLKSDIETVSEIKEQLEKSLLEIEQYKKEYQDLINELKEIKLILNDRNDKKEPFYMKLLHYIKKGG